MANKRTAELSNAQQEEGRAASPANARSKNSSSQASSPREETAKNQIDFQFLNFSHPGDAKASSARKAVRSHVTKQQHAKEQRLQQERRTQSYQGKILESEPQAATTQPRPHAETSPPARPTTLEMLTRAARPSLSLKSSPESSSTSRSPSASPTSPPQQILDYTELYPPDWVPYVHPLLEHYSKDIACDDPYIDGIATSGLLRTSFLPFAMTDPATLHALLLLSGTHYSRTRGSHSHPIDLLRLQGMAISEINRALADPSRATSNALIAAVAQMARYEALFGDRDIFNTHMTGLLRIVALRGGLVNLGMDGLLERLLLWIDANTAYLLGGRVYFDPGAYPASITHPRPDPVKFSAGLIRQAR